jgi:predicted metal-dependent phosphoesterase TrpH
MSDSTLQEFNQDRWERAGAEPEEVAALIAHHELQTPEERAGIGTWMRSVSDADLLEWLRSREEDPVFSDATEKLSKVAEAQEKVDQAEADVAESTGKKLSAAKGRLTRAKKRLEALTDEAADVVVDLHEQQVPSEDEQTAQDAAAAHESDLDAAQDAANGEPGTDPQE